MGMKREFNASYGAVEMDNLEGGETVQHSTQSKKVLLELLSKFQDRRTQCDSKCPVLQQIWSFKQRNNAVTDKYIK